MEMSVMKAPRFFWRLIKIGPQIAYALGLGGMIGGSILLLTTRGRKTGLARVTPLVYEQQGNTYIVASARGLVADWILNILADPGVQVQVGRRSFAGTAEVTTDPERITEYLQHQIERNPGMFGRILRFEGLSVPPSRVELLQFAPQRPMVTIYPHGNLNNLG
jgi:deazaflavin-dependent oxidoreductase (nitroreductase family)